MARHTSERERRADDAERELVQWKKVRFMADKVGDEFEGYITGVTAFGLFIELVEHFVEGLVHISTMADDYYRFVERAHILHGENTGKEYRLGDKVRGAGGQGRHGAAPGRSGPGRHPGGGAGVRREPRTPPEQCGAATAAPGRGRIGTKLGTRPDQGQGQEGQAKERRDAQTAAWPPRTIRQERQVTEAMKNVLGQELRLDDAFLDRMRQTVDPPADAVATTLVDQGAHRLVATLIKNRQMWDADGEPSRLLPEDVRAYMKTASALPPWRDEALVNEAEAFFLLYGLASSTLLACASLPQCYVMKYGTEVLAYTKFLQVDPTRRVRETAQMVMDVMVPGGLDADGTRRARDHEGAGHARDRAAHDPERSARGREPGRPGASSASSACRSIRRTWSTP